MTTLHDLLLEAGVTSAAGRLAQPRPVPYRNATAPRPLPRYRRTYLPLDQEAQFRQQYAQEAAQTGIDPNPDAPEHHYDYRAAYLAGEGPNGSGHWSSRFKDPDHPRLYLPEGEGGEAINTATGEPVPARMLFYNSGTIRPLPRTMRPADVRANDPQLAQSERDIARRELQRGDTLGRLADMGAAQSAPDPIHTPLQSNVIAGSRMVLPGAYDAGNAAGRIARGENAWGDLALNTGMAALPFLGVRGMRGEPAPAPMREPLPPQAWSAFGDLPPAEAPRPNGPLQASGTRASSARNMDGRTVRPVIDGQTPMTYERSPGEGAVDPNSWRVTGAYLPPEQRGRGLAVRAYERALTDARKSGVQWLESDTIRPGSDAPRIYEALRRRGYNVENLPYGRFRVETTRGATPAPQASPDASHARIVRRTIDAQHAPGYGEGTFEILQNPTVAQIERFVSREMRDPANSWVRDARRMGGNPKDYYPLRYLQDVDGNIYISSGLNVEHSHMAQGLRARGIDLGNDTSRSEFGVGQLQFRDGQWQFERGSESSGGDFATSRDLFEPLDPNYPNVRRPVQQSDGNAASGGRALEGEVMPHPIAPRSSGGAFPTEFRREPAQSNDPLAAGYGFDGPRNTRFRLSVDPGPTGAEVTLEAFDPQGRTIYDMPNHFSPAEAMEIYRNAEGALRSDMSMYQRDAYMISGMDDRLSALHEAMLRRAERRGELPSGFELRTNVPGLGGSFLNRPGSPAIEAQTRMGEALGRLDAARLEHRPVRSLQSPNANAPPPPDRTPKSLPRRKPPLGGFSMFGAPR